MLVKDDIIQLVLNSRKTTFLKLTIKEFMEPYENKYSKRWPLYQKAYHELFLNGDTHDVICPVCCVTKLKFKGLKKGYASNCSYTCRSQNPETVLKAKNTNLFRYGTEFASQSSQFRDSVIKTCMDKYGTDNVFKVDAIKNKQVETVVSRYGVTNISKNPEIIKRINDVHVSQGRRRPEHLRSDLEKYRLAVKSITARSYHDYYYVINPDNLPRSRYEYHVDHIYSVEEGFKNNVPPEIIGHYTNLRMLWHLDNSRKNTKCAMTLEELYESYNRSNQLSLNKTES